MPQAPCLMSNASMWHAPPPMLHASCPMLPMHPMHRCLMPPHASCLRLRAVSNTPGSVLDARGRLLGQGGAPGSDRSGLLAAGGSRATSVKTNSTTGLSPESVAGLPTVGKR